MYVSSKDDVCFHGFLELDTLFYDVTRDSIANNFVIDFYCRCLYILYQIAINCKI